jgi:hypothetical protein
MKKRLLLFTYAGILILITIHLSAQVGINADGTLPDPSAMLDVKSTSKGMLIPRMNQAQRETILSPAAGLTIFQTDNTPGIYYNSGSSVSPIWVIAGNGSFWGLSGNSGTNPSTNFVGTTDAHPLMFKVNNQKSGCIDYASPFNTSFGYQSLNSSIYSYNSAFGYQALFSNTTGYENTANGYQALYSNTEGWENTANGLATLYSNTTGYRNTASGYAGLTNNTTGYSNSANGFMTLYSNTIGYENTANGHGALYSNVAGNYGVAIGYNSQTYANNKSTPWDNTNTSIGYQSLMGSSYPPNNTGTGNTAIGHDALFSNSFGSNNTANGLSALFSNTTGYGNTAVGNDALFSNTTGYENTANGKDALYSNIIGYGNTANGQAALYSNTTGYRNIANGKAALYSNTTGYGNTANGVDALFFNTTGSNNTANGYDALANNAEGSYNTAMGSFSGTADGYSNLNNTIGIGNFNCQNWTSNLAIFGGLSTTWNGGNVTWSTFSDARVKTNVQEDVKGLDFITRLRPVTYYRNIKAMAEITGNKETGDYPEKYDIEKIKFSGFLAQDVEQAAKQANYNFSGITVPKNSKELYTLSYEQFVVPLVKAVQELNSRNEAQKITNEELKLAIEELKVTNEQLMKRMKKLETK